ncbi:Branched-chain amino acid aminotransferase/4-amino-4-deoxychorismate lyase [Rathayibacter oskolensis]|uniref:Branched-chain amino acid aminotransferase/4-amino-4-deoxychorismate lyase n=1 Tax=Rathayibacter oskolensis TaxID=1891671 RepID=A0A1X7ND17_9MICO|nr:aminotransferase class IV [Rathayibacter oskolensis]SMH35562.1 Branched-chain amino acid aminotransferase/4-amino-4-deoxychorismate lyase [Rathayibacter oskolensis]
MDGEQVREWNGQLLGPPLEPEPTPLLAADSWLVTEGRVRGLDLHRERFLAAVSAADGPSDAGTFFDAAVAALPRQGDLFPRVELDASGLRLRLRPAPPRSRTVVLWTSPVDPRRVPAHKGPDIARLALLRSRAIANGADEAVILDGEGAILDGATSAVLWWLGDSLVVPPPTSTRVPSVTARTISVLAGAMGVDVLEAPTAPESLDGREVWVVNALHGARLATSWVGGPALAAEPGRLDAWRLRLDALRRPLP